MLVFARMLLENGGLSGSFRPNYWEQGREREEYL